MILLRVGRETREHTITSSPFLGVNGLAARWRTRGNRRRWGGDRVFGREGKVRKPKENSLRMSKKLPILDQLGHDEGVDVLSKCVESSVKEK